MIGSVARRYAKALFALARERQTLQSTADELSALAAIARDPAVDAALNNPMFSPQKRRQIADLIIRDSHPSELLAQFLRLLADRQRLGELTGIAREFQRLLDQELGQVRMIVRSPSALPPAQQQEIIATFARIIGKKVLPQFEIDPTLLGGVVVEAEGKVYDGSLKTQFERLAKQLSGSAH